MTSRRQLTAELFLVVATIIWGGTFAVTRLGLNHISPLFLIAVRFLGAAAIIGPFLAARGNRWWSKPGPGLWLGLFVFLGYTLQTVGLQYTTSARSAFITYLFAIFIPPLQRLISHRRLSPGNLVGLGIVIGGVVVMTRPWTLAGWNAGDLVTLGSAFSFAMFIVLVDRFSATADAAAFVPVQFLVAGTLSLVAALALEGIRFEPTASLWMALGYLTLLGTVGALGIQTLFQGRTTPVRATTIYALEPVFASLFGLAILGEGMTSLELAGAAVIIAGVLLSELWEYLRRAYLRRLP